MPSLKILITGCSGFIGYWCVKRFLEAGYQVDGVGVKEGYAAKGLQYHSVDVHDQKAVESLMSRIKPDYLLHLAWYVEHGKYWQSAENTRWVKSSEKLFKAFMAEGGRRIVVSGTCAEYAWGNPEPFSEVHTLLKPSTAYGQAKLDLLGRLDELSRSSKTSYAWGRIFYPYGPGEARLRWLPSLICAALKNEPLPRVQGSRLRDLIYVEDLAEGFLRLIESSVRGPINLASGVPHTMEDVIREVYDSLKIPTEKLHEALHDGAGDDLEDQITADTQRMREALSWTPGIDLQAGIEKTVHWWKNRFSESS